MSRHLSKEIMEAKGWKLIGAPGSLKYIRKDLILVDLNYQRDLETNKVKKIAAEWNWVALGALILARRDKKLYVVDGQHRLYAALMREDIKSLPCVVFESAGVEREAKDFVSIQKNRMAMMSWDVYKALLASGDETALELEKIVNSSGRSVSKRNSNSSIRCVSRLMDQVRQNKEKLTNIFPLMSRLMEGHPFHERIVAAIFYVETRLPDGVSLSDKRWTNRILEIGYDEILLSIGRACAYHIRGSDAVFAEGLLNAINYNLKNKLRLQDDKS